MVIINVKRLYTKPAALPMLFVDRSFRELFQILYLGKKYLIDSLVSRMTEIIAEKEIKVVQALGL